jgi:TRAP-type transport system small permease protein
MFLWGIARPQTTPALRLPLWIPQIAIMLAAVGCFAYALRDLVRAASALRRGEG